MTNLTAEEIAVLRENIELMRAHSTWQANWYIRDISRLLDALGKDDITATEILERRASFGFGKLQ